MSWPIERFSERAAVYHDSRWPYAPAAIDALFEIAGLSHRSTVADIGAGTGMLARHFVGRVGCVYAVEPSAEMRAVAEATLGADPTFHSIDALADATGLAAASVDLIAVGRALHWFPPASTRQEFLRILAPRGYLAVLGVTYADEELHAAADAIRTPENGCRMAESEPHRQRTPISHYFGDQPCQTMHVPGLQIERWPQFLGRLLSFSAAPTPADPLYPRFEAAARTVFDRFAAGGAIEIATSTDLSVGLL